MPTQRISDEELLDRLLPVMSHKGEIYRHCRTGDEYIITGAYVNETTLEVSVVYRKRGSSLSFGRSWAKFSEPGRFQRIND